MTPDQEQPSTTAEPPTGEADEAADHATTDTPAPADETPAPVDDAPAPPDDAPAPADEAPVSVDDTPVSSDDTPAPADETPAPVDDAPASPDDAPASPDDAPASPDDAPASPDDTPAPTDDTLTPSDEVDEAAVTTVEETTSPEFDEPPSSATDGNEISTSPEADQMDGPDDNAEGSRRGMLVGLSLLAVVLVGILVAVLATGGGDGGSPAASPSTTSARSTSPTLPQAAFKSFHDDLTGFTIQYPASWQQAQAPVSELRLFVTPGEGEAVSVRVNDTEQVTTPENLANIKSVTDGTIASNPTAKVLKNAAITLNGLIGYYYLYTFKDGTSGLEGVHAHYFLFKGHHMYSIVFQVLPTDQFEQFAGVFDQIAQSFKVDG